MCWRNISLIRCAHSWNIFQQIIKEKFRISERQCTILYVYIFFSYINITLSLNKAHRKSRTILQGNWKLWIKREGQEKIWLWAGSIYTFLQILSNTGMDRKGNIVFFFFSRWYETLDLTVTNNQMCQIIGPYRNLIIFSQKRPFVWVKKK